MGILVLGLLLAAWGLVLGPTLLRNAQETSPIRTEMMFHRALKAMAGPRRPRDAMGGRWVMVPRTSDYPRYRERTGGRAGAASATSSARRSAAERRRRNMTALSAFVIVTFFTGLLPPLDFLLWPCLLASVLLIAYVVAALVFAARPVAVQQRTATEDVRPPEVAGGGL